MTSVPVATASEMETEFTSRSNTVGLSLTSSKAMLTRASVEVAFSESEALTVWRRERGGGRKDERNGVNNGTEQEGERKGGEL